MTDADWLDEEEAPRKKGGMRKWLLAGCGCGCLFFVLAGVVVAVLGARAADPDRQWPRLQEVLHFEERPELELEMGMPFNFSFEQYVLTDPDSGLQIQIQSFGADAPEETLDPIFSEESLDVPFGLAEPVDPEATEIELQGRRVRALRYATLGGFGEVLGPGIRVDISREGRCAYVQISRVGSDEPPTDEEVAQVFSWFDVWEEE